MSSSAIAMALRRDEEDARRIGASGARFKGVSRLVIMRTTFSIEGPGRARPKRPRLLRARIFRKATHENPHRAPRISPPSCDLVVQHKHT